VTPIPSTGDPGADLLAVLGEFTNLDGVSVIASEHALVAIGVAMPGALQGGRLFGIVPVVASSAAGTNLIAIHGPSVLYADPGRMEMDVAHHATLRMDTDPEDPDASLASLWQQNLTGLRLIRYINWQAREDAVAVVSGAEYGAGG
jgi:hypothetical protein